MSIQITATAVREYALELEKLGKTMQQTMEGANSTVRSLREDWKDAVKEEFDAEFDRLKRSFDSFVESSIPSYAREAREHADTMEQIGKR